MQILEKGDYFTKIELEIPNELIENAIFVVHQVDSKLSKIYGKGYFADLESVFINCLEHSDFNQDPDFEIERLFTELDEFEKKYSNN